MEKQLELECQIAALVRQMRGVLDRVKEAPKHGNSNAVPETLMPALQ